MRCLALIFCLLLTAPAAGDDRSDDTVDLPWAAAGLDERAAAAHLLDRFAYGPRPGDIDAVVEMGLDVWLDRQLAMSHPDRHIDEALDFAESLDMPTRQLAETYVNPGMILRMAQRDGAISQEQMASIQESRGEDGDRRARRGQRRELVEWARDQGFRAQRDALGELMVQKLVRATYSDNPLREVLVDFWFNHFNVSITDNQARIYVWPYERDAIRPHVLGDFRDMLGATAKHPAMLHYLDNVQSVADAGATTTVDARRAAFDGRRGRLGRRDGRGGEARRQRQQPPGRQRPSGLNENYARELLELHTLGVDGGYTQDDVVEVARAFTGWATYPAGPRSREIERRIEQARRYPGAGFVIEDTFVFRADSHDAGEKTVLGTAMPAGRGIEDGEQVLDLVATHPSTARHLATKLARRFVSDQPPQMLIDRLAATWLDTDGDLRAVLVALVEAPAFWSTEARQAKIKSPFELTVSALRATGARIDDPRALLEWISRMGQPLYAYQAPTGYPDRADHWVNTGALLERMNFGLQLASGRVAGVRLDLPALIGGREPESLDDALTAYLTVLLPERDSSTTLARLEPMVRDPELAKKIAAAAPESEARDPLEELDDWDGGMVPGMPRGPRRGRDRPSPPLHIDDSPVAHVVGVILGSPEFQRR